MKNLFFYIILIFSFSLSQDSRSIIFNTGTPETEDGYIISGETSFANRFSVLDDYALEALKVTMSKESDFSSVLISVHEDSDNSPGEEIGNWVLSLSTNTPREYTIYTLDECITFNANQNYWLSVKANDETSSARWIYSPSDSYNYSISTDGQETWASSLGFAGSTKIYAEIFYTPDPVYGDVNLDEQLNVLDVVTIVSYVVGAINLNSEQLNLGDANNDFSVDVLDIVQIVSTIVNQEPLPSFSLLDFNPNSEYNGEFIGPEVFRPEVSVYYFGKQG